MTRIWCKRCNEKKTGAVHGLCVNCSSNINKAFRKKQRFKNWRYTDKPTLDKENMRAMEWFTLAREGNNSLILIWWHFGRVLERLTPVLILNFDGILSTFFPGLNVSFNFIIIWGVKWNKQDSCWKNVPDVVIRLKKHMNGIRFCNYNICFFNEMKGKWG